MCALSSLSKSVVSGFCSINLCGFFFPFFTQPTALPIKNEVQKIVKYVIRRVRKIEAIILEE